MQIKTKIILCIVAQAAIINILSFITVWNVSVQTKNYTKIDVVEMQLRNLSQLESASLNLFIDIRRDLLDEKAIPNFDLDLRFENLYKLISEIEKNTSKKLTLRLRRTQAKEYLSADHSMRSGLKRIYDNVQAAQSLMAINQIKKGQKLLREVLNQRTNEYYMNQLIVAVAMEKAEILQLNSEIELANAHAKFVAYSAAISAVILTALVAHILIFRLARGLSQLNEGASAIAEGRFEQRIDLPGTDELSGLANSVNQMAHHVLVERKALKLSNTLLDHKVTDRTRELSLANAELKKRDNLRSQFFADIGHELRTPITVIRGEAEVALLEMDEGHDRYRGSLELILVVASQLAQLINDIFLIAREQAGVSDMRMTEVDLKQILEDTSRQMEGVIAQSNIALHLKLAAEEASVEGDHRRLIQLMTILVSNSLQHSVGCRKILIELRQQNSNWLIVFEDDGPGIAQDEAYAVFDRFYSNPSNIHIRENGHSGLGLSIARSIVKSHGGRIWVDTDYNAGARFCMTFPVINEVPSATNRPKGEAEIT